MATYRNGQQPLNDRGHYTIAFFDDGASVGGSPCIDAGAGLTVVIDPITGCAVFSALGVGGVTRQNVYDTQGPAVVTTTTAADLDVGATFAWSLLLAGVPAFVVDDVSRTVRVGAGATGLASGPGYFNDAGPIGTGFVGGEFARTIKVETEFGSDLVFGFHQPISGRVGVQSLTTGLHFVGAGDMVFASSVEGGDVLFQTATATSAGFTSGASRTTTGNTTSATGGTGNVDSQPGGATVAGATLGAVRSLAPLSLAGVPVGETFPIHEFANLSAEPTAQRYKTFAGVSDPNLIPLSAETGSTFHRDTGVTATSGLWVNNSPGGFGALWAKLGIGLPGPIGPVGPAGPVTATFTFGGKLSFFGRHPEVNGKSSTATGTNFDQDTEVSAPFAATTIAFAWNSANADATTILTVMRNAVPEDAITLSGAAGAFSGRLVTILQGDLLSIEFTSGMDPGNMNCQLVLGG